MSIPVAVTDDFFFFFFFFISILRDEKGFSAPTIKDYQAAFNHVFSLSGNEQGCQNATPKTLHLPF